MLLLNKLLETPFSDWLRNNGVWIAVSVSGLLLILLIILFILNSKKER